MSHPLLRPAAALIIATLAVAFVALGTASAQEGSDPGRPVPCAPDETCVEPAPCPDGDCDVPGEPPTCPPEEPCEVPVPPPCPPDELCIDPIPCPINGPCGEEPVDSDGDGFYDFDEEFYGSDPDDAASTPEHGYLPETCADGVDNDGDGATDLADRGCNVDSDEDGVPDPTDNCPWDPNASQSDRDGDGVGDACDYDADNDGWDDESERFYGSDPADPASTPEHGYVIETCADGVDNDGDGATDLADDGCNVDSDEDGVPDATDNCPWDPNSGQADRDADGFGDVCDYDLDNDGWDDESERLYGSDPDDAASTPEHTFIENTCADGLDNDADGVTDAADRGCAPDRDYDLTPDDEDNCPDAYNYEQADRDNDGRGDACEDEDGDGFVDQDEIWFESDPDDAASTPETAAYFETCEDGIDNDLDGLVDGEEEFCQFVILEDHAASPPSVRTDAGVDDARDVDGGGKAAPVALPSAGIADEGSGGVAWQWFAAAALAAGVALSAGALALRRAKAR